MLNVKENHMIWMSDEWKEYEVLDAADGERLERW